MNELLLCVDVETTGLNPEKEKLLQVAAKVIDTNGNIISDTDFIEIVKHDNATELRSNAVEYVQNMHDATGLWEQLENGKDLAELDELLYKYIKRYAPVEREIRLMGSSCRLDLNFLEKYLPRSYHHLHYRSVDVSALAYTLYNWGIVNSYYQKQHVHDALSDINETIAEYKFLMDNTVN